MLLPPNDFSLNPSSEATPQSLPNITLDAVLKLAEELRDKRPKIYYGLSVDVPPGESFFVRAGEYHPRFFVCHPDDLDMITTQLAPMNVLPISEYKPTWPGLQL